VAAQLVGTVTTSTGPDDEYSDRIESKMCWCAGL
jgi:hypothetical protein